MAESIEEKVVKSINAVEEMYHRLVLIVGKSGTGKTAIIQRLAKQYETTPININLHLSKELLELTEKQRQLKLSKLLDEAVAGVGKRVFLDNIEILFDVELKQDPLRLLQGLSRNLTVVASWNGTFDRGKLTYSEPWHHEYKSYDLIDVLVVSMSGEATIDFKPLREGKRT